MILGTIVMILYSLKKAFAHPHPALKLNDITWVIVRAIEFFSEIKSARLSCPRSIGDRF